jgi:glycosyltransferase involved in cell wall biosynthesis
MKICYLADAKSIHTQRWVSYFAERGHEVHLISKNFAFPLPNVKSHLLKRLPESKLTLPINTISTVLQIKNLIRKIKPDIVHAHYVLDYGFYGALANFHPLVVTAWGSDVLLNQSRTTRYALKKADVITCDGENSRQAIIDLGINKEKIKLISHGVNIFKFCPNYPDPRQLKEKLSLSGPTAISLRSLKPIYDVLSFIRAVPIVLIKAPDAKFIVVGDGPERGFLENLVNLGGFKDSVIFVGLISHDKIPDYLAAADVYVSTSLSDGGIAVSTLEAMSSGLVPISTDVGDVRDWISDGVNGFVIPIKDPVTLAEKIIYLFQNRDARTEFGEKSRDMVCERADYYKEMKKVEEMYKELVETNRIFRNLCEGKR